MVQANGISAVVNLLTVAEYVETDEIRLRVATLGVDYGQGFAIARPVPLTQTVLELPMYSRAERVYPVDETQGEEIILGEAEFEAALSSGTATIDLSREAARSEADDSGTDMDSNEDTHRRPRSFSAVMTTASRPCTSASAAAADLLACDRPRWPRLTAFRTGCGVRVRGADSLVC